MDSMVLGLLCIAAGLIIRLVSDGKLKKLEREFIESLNNIKPIDESIESVDAR